MIFTDIRLQKFRSYEDASFELTPGVNIVVGPNAIGKTNLIEALLICARSKSYRDNGYIKNSAKWARLDAHTSKNELRTAKFIIEGSVVQKSFEIDEKSYKRLPEGKKQPVVLFEPNDLMLLHGDPSGRRRFIDNLCSQLDLEYKTVLNRYKRTLAQRNTALKNPVKLDNQLFVWNIKLVEIASELVQKRLEVIGQIDAVLAQKYSQIADKKTKLKISYQTELTTKNYASSMMNKLEKQLELDALRGFTGTGPHRDDITFEFDKKLHSSEASRGEARSLVLALKLIELELLEAIKGEKPLLLLDDVFSELDGKRRKALTGYLKGHQTVITTTDADVVLKNFSKNTHIIAI